MLIPVGRDIDLAVELVCATSATPIHAAGRLVRYEGDRCAVRLHAVGVPLSPGDRVVVTVLGDGGERIQGEVTGVEHGRVELAVRRARRRDQRDYPRVDGGLEVRYRQLEGGDHSRTVRAWLAGLGDAAGTWVEPPRHMNVSGSGLRFWAETAPADGQRLLLELRIPPTDGAHRLSAEVVRSTPSPTGGHDVAIRFDDVPAAAQDALTQYIFDQQTAAFGALGE